jgi:hypothetical protein
MPLSQTYLLHMMNVSLYREGALRYEDMRDTKLKVLIHIIIMLLISSTVMIPYLASSATSWFIYRHGLQYFLMIVTLSCCVVSLTPFMLTRKNRLLIYQYVRHHFSRNRMGDTDLIIRDKLPLFQSLYLSSVVVCLGSTLSLLSFLYFGIDREMRNTLLKLTFAIAGSLLTFFLCQSFERFFNQWFWVIVAVYLAKSIEMHVNPMSRDKALIVCILCSFGLKLVLPSIVKVLGINRMIRYVTSTSVRLGLSAVLTFFRKRKVPLQASQLSQDITSEPYDGFFETEGIELIGQDDMDAIASDFGLNDDDSTNSIPNAALHRPTTPNSVRESGSHREYLQSVLDIDFKVFDVFTPVVDIPEICPDEIENEMGDMLNFNFSHEPDNDVGSAPEENVNGSLLHSLEVEDDLGQTPSVPSPLMTETVCPYHADGFDYFVGGVVIPVSMAGPLCLDGKQVWIPLLTPDAPIVEAIQQGCESLRLCVLESLLASDTHFLMDALLELESSMQATLLQNWLMLESTAETIDVVCRNDSNVSSMKITGKSTGKRLLLRVTYICKLSSTSTKAYLTSQGLKLLESVLNIIREDETFVTVSSHIFDRSCVIHQTGHVNIFTNVTVESLRRRSVNISQVLHTYESVKAYIQLGRHMQPATIPEVIENMFSAVRSVLAAIGNYETFVDDAYLFTVSIEECEDGLHVECSSNLILNGIINDKLTSPAQKQCRSLLHSLSSSEGEENDYNGVSRVVAGVALSVYLEYIISLASA